MVCMGPWGASMEESFGKEAAPGPKAFGPWARLARPQKRGKTGSLTTPGLLCDVSTIGRGDFGQQSYGKEKTHPVECPEISRRDIGNSEDGQHDVLVLSPGKCRDFGSGVRDGELAVDSREEAAYRGEPCRW